MARVSNPLIGKSRNKIGSVVFTNWKGINVLKEKPATVANPNTDNQIMRRSAFTQIIAIARLIYAAIFVGFKEQAVQKSEVNAFTGYALSNAFDYNSPPTALLNPDGLLISQGTITPVLISSCTADRSLNTIVTTFPGTATAPGQSASDRAIVVAYNDDKNDWYAEVTTAQRSTGTCSITLPASWTTGDNLQVYLGFYNPASGKAADSKYTTTSIVA